MRRTGLLLLALGCARILFAQNGIPQVDSFLTRMHAGGKFNGGVLIAEKGKIVFTRCLGYADVEKRIPNSLAARFDIASVSKTFTAVAILQLMERKQLRLDDPFARWFPDFPYPEVTIRHLLTHTSGLPDEFDLFDPVTTRYPDSVLRNKDLLPLLKGYGKPLRFHPGDEFRYCNTNYELLALLVEKAAHQSFGEYIRQHIFRPAHMDHSYVKASGTGGEPGAWMQPDTLAVKRYVLPYWYSTAYQDVDSVRQGRFHTGNYTYNGTVGDNNIVSTLGDLLQYDQALYGQGLLQAPTLAMAFSPMRLNNGNVSNDHADDSTLPQASYGLGWFVAADAGGGKLVYHDGYNPGASTMLYRDIAKQRTIIFFDNTNDDQFYKTLAIAALLDGKRPPRAWDFAFRLKKSLARWYGADLLTKGPDAALIQLLQRQQDTAHYYLNRREVTWLGFDLLRAGYRDAGLESFRVNLFLFPADAGAFGNYGLALSDAGKKEEAIAIYRLALAAHPGDKIIGQLLEKELKN